jgi:hypothetical protein
MKWIARLTVQGVVEKHLGSFDDKEAASWAYKKAAIERCRLDQLNFELTETALASPASQLEPSRVRGVGWHKPSRKWRARLLEHGVQKHLGYFDDQEAAVRAYDTAAIERGLLYRLNFHDYELPVTASASSPPQLEIRRLQGVTWHKTPENVEPE